MLLVRLFNHGDGWGFWVTDGRERVGSGKGLHDKLTAAREAMTIARPLLDQGELFSYRPGDYATEYFPRHYRDGLNVPTLTRRNPPCPTLFPLT